VKTGVLFACLAASYVLLVDLPWGLWVSNLPQASFNPPVSIAALFTDYPPFWVMFALNAVAVAAAAALLIGWRTVASSLTLALMLMLLHGFSFGDGKIDQITVIVLIPLTLAYSGWGRAFSIENRNEPPSADQPWLLALLALLTGFALFTAGIGKISGGWLKSDSLGTRWHLLWNYYSVGRETLVGSWALQNLPRWGWKAMDWSVAVWEAGFVLTVFRRTWCRVACAFGALALRASSARERRHRGRALDLPLRGPRRPRARARGAGVAALAGRADRRGAVLLRPGPVRLARSNLTVSGADARYCSGLRSPSSVGISSLTVGCTCIVRRRVV